ncbi:MAG TPA: hypothetical protein VIH87_04035 [Methylocella sp.]
MRRKNENLYKAIGLLGQAPGAAMAVAHDLSGLGSRRKRPRRPLLGILLHQPFDELLAA